MRYDFLADEWINLGRLPNGEQFYHGCGFATNMEGQLELIVTGRVRFDDLDIYNLETGLWRTSGKYVNTVTEILYPVPKVEVGRLLKNSNRLINQNVAQK